MKLASTLANGAWLASNLAAWDRFRCALRNPREVQLEILGRLVVNNSDTAYGRAHHFGRITDYAEFRERVPIVDYEELEPWIARLERGESGVLTHEPVTRLVPTSGSTAGRKLIPFTPAFQAELNAAIGPWIVDLCWQHPSIPFGPAYWSISPAMPRLDGEPSAIPIGFDDDSAYLGGIRQRLAEATFAVPPQLSRITDIECSRYLTLLCLLRQPELRLISVWHPSFLTLLLDALPGWWDELLHDLESGGCHRSEAVVAGIRQVTSARPQSRRAHQLRRADPSRPETIWPHLAVVSCWGDAQAGLALAELQRRLPSVAIQSKGLLATEAFISIPFAGAHPVAIASHFFEFENARGQIFLASELTPGETYGVIVTTSGGLYRYRLGDMVEVDGTVEATPSLRFLGRGSRVSDVCGEKLAEVFVTRVLEVACAAVGAAPTFAMLAPTSEGNGRWTYTLFIEGEVPRDLADRVEQQLRENPHYALCRDLGQLQPLRCFPIAHGAYETFCQVIAGQGRRVGDIKPQALSSRTDWAEHFRGCQPGDGAAGETRGSAGGR